MDRGNHIPRSRIKIRNERKPIKLLLEIILNRKKVTYEAPVRMSDLNTTFSSLNSSNDTLEECLDASINKESTPDSSKALLKKRKTKSVEIKIKLDISDASNDSNVSINSDVVELQSTRISSKINLHAKDAAVVNELEERISSTSAMRRMSSRVSLAITDNNKQIENQEETVYFDVSPESYQEKCNNSKNLTKIELDSSHNQSFWHKIFEKIQNNSQTTCDDKKIVEVIHDLIMQKYKQALHIIKQRIEKREHGVKHNKTNSHLLDDLNKLFEQEKSFNDFKVDLEKSDDSNLDIKNTTMEDLSNNDPMKPGENNIISTRNAASVNKDLEKFVNLSNDKLPVREEKYNSTGTLMDSPKTPEKGFSDFEDKCASEDFIPFECQENRRKTYNLRNENVRSFLKNEGNSMYRDINKILESEISLPRSLHEEIVEYDAGKFLRTALGDEADCSFESQSDLYDSPTLETPNTWKTEQSIGSSNISMLMSESDRRKSAGIYSLYSTVKKNFKKKPNNQTRTMAKSTKSSYNDYGYESLDDLDINNHERTLMKDIVRQNEIIYQIGKAVTVCRSSPEFFEPNIMVEAEKILLVASIRKDIIDEELKKIDYEEIDQRLTSCSVIIKDLELHSKYSTMVAKNIKNCDFYYVCAVRHGCTVYATKTLMQQDKDIKFPEKFHFEGLPSDFEMHVSIYGLMLKNKKNKKAKSRHELKTVPCSSSDSKTSNFVLWGTTMIKPSQSNQTVFSLSQVFQESPITDVLNATIETTFRIHIRESGFLTVGIEYKGHPIWNRRWCSLNGSRLRYWNYPNEEQHCEPLGVLDLLNSTSTEVQRAEKYICPSPRTLLIYMKGYEDGKSIQRRYFLAADNMSDFKRWQENLNLVLGYIGQWNNYECFLDN